MQGLSTDPWHSQKSARNFTVGPPCLQFCICGEALSNYCFTYCFYFFLSSPSNIPIAHMFYLCNCLTVLGYSILFFSDLFHFDFQFCKFLIVISLSSEILYSAISGLLMSTSKAFFISVTVVFAPSFSFSFSAYIAICSCMVSTFSIKSLSILIMVF